MSLFHRVRRQALNRISAFEGFWRRRAGDLLKEVRSGLTTLAEGVTEDTNEEMSLIVVYAGAKTAWEVEDVLERQRVKVWYITGKTGSRETALCRPYRT